MMIQRIGNLAYFLGPIFGILVFFGSISGYRHDLIGGLIGAALCVGGGWAIRYVLTGRSDWEFTL
ncbi:UNVERIFIED_ORG: hypothetical protein J2W66_003162 [Agrobacterium larrymoorei]|jgi:hypothetical protein|nr:hypothetical protein [Agrobacterium larrymoorei]